MSGKYRFHLSVAWQALILAAASSGWAAPSRWDWRRCTPISTTMPVPRRQPPHPKPAATPLDQRAAQVNARVALDIVRNTSLPDNLAFFTHKLRAWLLYSTPELQVSYELRAIRFFERLTLTAAAIALVWRWRAPLLLQVTPSYPSVQPWFTPRPERYLQLDGTPHTYALHGNDPLRPAGAGAMGITLSCPPGTLVTWEGAELLRSTLPEAARDLIQHGTPIDPYHRGEPRPSTP